MRKEGYVPYPPAVAEISTPAKLKKKIDQLLRQDGLDMMRTAKLDSRGKKGI